MATAAALSAPNQHIFKINQPALNQPNNGSAILAVLLGDIQRGVTVLRAWAKPDAQPTQRQRRNVNAWCKRNTAQFTVERKYAIPCSGGATD